MKEVEKKYVVLYMFLFLGGEGGRVGYPGFICEVLVSEKWCCCFVCCWHWSQKHVMYCSVLSEPSKDTNQDQLQWPSMACSRATTFHPVMFFVANKKHWTNAQMKWTCFKRNHTRWAPYQMSCNPPINGGIYLYIYIYIYILFTYWYKYIDILIYI